MLEGTGLVNFSATYANLKNELSILINHEIKITDYYCKSIKINKSAMNQKVLQ